MSTPRFGWPPHPGERPAPRIDTEIVLAAPCERVFDFVTTPALWHTWHPATAGVADVPTRPLVAGESVVEHIRAGGRRFDATWTVLACEPPSLWVIATDSELGSSRIVYRLAPLAGGCRFRRTLEYRSHRMPWRLFDASITRWVLGRQSARALANLKRALEA